MTKTSIGFLCRQGLNPKFFIQLSDTLLVKLTETYYVILWYMLTSIYYDDITMTQLVRFVGWGESFENKKKKKKKKFRTSEENYLATSGDQHWSLKFFG